MMTTIDTEQTKIANNTVSIFRPTEDLAITPPYPAGERRREGAQSLHAHHDI